MQTPVLDPRVSVNIRILLAHLNNPVLRKPVRVVQGIGMNHRSQFEGVLPVPQNDRLLNVAVDIAEHALNRRAQSNQQNLQNKRTESISDHFTSSVILMRRSRTHRLPLCTHGKGQRPVLLVDTYELTIKVGRQQLFFVEQIATIQTDAYSIVQLPGEIHVQAAEGLVPD